MESNGSTVGWFYVPMQNVGRLAEKIERLTQRAVRLGCPPIMFQTGVDFERSTGRDEITGIEHFITLRPVVVSGTAPKLNGWTLQGVLAHIEGEVMLRAVPGIELPTEYRSARPEECDHCHTARRRVETFVLRHDDGRYVHVGRNCLADFLGHQNPQMLAQFATYLWSVMGLCEEMGDEHGARTHFSIPLERFLAMTSAAIRMEGWISRKKAREEYDNGCRQATADTTMGAFICRHVGKCQHPDINESDRETAKQAAGWAAAIEGDDLSDYMHNVAVVGRLGVVDGRTAGIAASIVPVYQRGLEQQRERERAVAKSNEHVGTIKKRQMFTLTLTGTRYLESDFGVRTLCIFEDEAGNSVKWFASGDKSDLEVGKTYSVKATPVRHSDYQGRNETIVNRAVIQ